jgi:type IV fimbrial biogenesis protein FimT
MKTSDKRIGMMTSTPRTRRSAFVQSTGFTMVEMLMTIAIATIVTMLAVPSFRYVTNANRISSEINGLLGDMQFARSEAIKEGKNVTVCVSSDGNTCINSTAWRSGWIVFSDPTNTGVHDAGETLLRVQKTFSGTDTFDSNGLTAVTFNREGYSPVAANTLITLHDTTNTSAWTRCLTLNFVGQITTLMVGTAPNGAVCS